MQAAPSTSSAEAEGFFFYNDDDEKTDLTNTDATRQATNGERRRRSPPKASAASSLDGQQKKRISIGSASVDSPFDIPLELWFEIFSYLYPIDLLHLSRTCKLFRSWLKHDLALLTWKAVSRLTPSYFQLTPPTTAQRHIEICLAQLWLNLQRIRTSFAGLISSSGRIVMFVLIHSVGTLFHGHSLGLWVELRHCHPLVYESKILRRVRTK